MLLLLLLQYQQHCWRFRGFSVGARESQNKREKTIKKKLGKLQGLPHVRLPVASIISGLMFLYILNCLLYEKYYIRRLRCQKGGVSLLDKIELLMGPPLLLKKVCTQNILICSWNVLFCKLQKCWPCLNIPLSLVWINTKSLLAPSFSSTTAST